MPNYRSPSDLPYHGTRQRLASDYAQVGAHATILQHAKLAESSNTLRNRIENWYQIQLLYMPEAAILRQNESKAEKAGCPETPAQSLPLYLPSSLNLRARCSIKLCDFEFQFRYAQAHDALNELRHHLRLRSHLWKFKTRFQRGQGPSTRSRNLIEQCTHRVNAAAAKYRVARQSLVNLSPRLEKVGWEVCLQVLNSSDIKAMTEDEKDMDPAARRQLQRQSEGRRVVSWIWMTPGVSGDEDIGLHDGTVANCLILTLTNLNSLSSSN